VSYFITSLLYIIFVFSPPPVLNITECRRNFFLHEKNDNVLSSLWSSPVFTGSKFRFKIFAGFSEFPYHEIFSLLAYYATYIGIYRCSRTVNKQSDPHSRVKHSLKMGPIGCPETSVTNYQSTSMMRNVSEFLRSHLHRGGSLKSPHYLTHLQSSEIVRPITLSLTALPSQGTINLWHPQLV
jgi:hypothetical protein